MVARFPVKNRMRGGHGQVGLDLSKVLVHLQQKGVTDKVPKLTETEYLLPPQSPAPPASFLTYYCVVLWKVACACVCAEC